MKLWRVIPKGEPVPSGLRWNIGEEIIVPLEVTDDPDAAAKAMVPMIDRFVDWESISSTYKEIYRKAAQAAILAGAPSLVAQNEALKADVHNKPLIYQALQAELGAANARIKEIEAEPMPGSLMDAASKPSGSISRIYQCDAEACCKSLDQKSQQIAELEKALKEERKAHFKNIEEEREIKSKKQRRINELTEALKLAEGLVLRHHDSSFHCEPGGFCPVCSPLDDAAFKAAFGPLHPKPDRVPFDRKRWDAGERHVFFRSPENSAFRNPQIVIAEVQINGQCIISISGGITRYHYNDGRYSLCGIESGVDLFMLPPAEPAKKTLFLQVEIKADRDGRHSVGAATDDRTDLMPMNGWEIVEFEVKGGAK